MKLVKKDLKTVKNELLCELEDYLVDGILPLMTSSKMDDDSQQKFAQELMNSILDSVKNNAVRFAMICYTDDKGKELNEDDLIGIPLKLKIITECLEDIMGIMGDYIKGSEDSAPSGKPRPKVTHRK